MWRYFGAGNRTEFNVNWVYAAESLLHEVRCCLPRLAHACVLLLSSGTILCCQSLQTANGKGS